MMKPKFFRRARERLERLAGLSRPSILMYHRIGQPGADPWNIAVSPQNFTSQMDVLSRLRRIVPLSALAPGAPRGDGRPPVAITFDDGYAGVIEHALPVLERHGFPATVFVTTGMLGSAREYWWDELTRIMLDHCWTREVDLAGPRDGTPIGRIGPDLSGGELRALHDRLWRELRGLADGDRSAWLARLADAAGCPLAARGSHRVMTPAEVAGTVGTVLSIGAHGRSHAPLVALDGPMLADEIAGSRDRCAELTGVRPDSFAYPFGDHDDASVAAVRDAGFVSAVTVMPGVVRPATDPLRLPRIEVRDWDAATFASHLP